MMMAGLDGIQNKIHPGEAADKDLYHLPPEEDKKIPRVCHSLDMALESLDKNREFLTKGGVFTDDLIDAYIELRSEEHTSELQSLMRISYAVFCLKKKKHIN